MLQQYLDIRIDCLERGFFFFFFGTRMANEMFKIKNSWSSNRTGRFSSVFIFVLYRINRRLERFL